MSSGSKEEGECFEKRFTQLIMLGLWRCKCKWWCSGS